MNSLRKALLCICCMLVAINVMGRERQLTRQDSDSISNALATIWSKSYRNIVINDGQSVASEYMRGVQDALTLHIDSAEIEVNTKRDAYNIGLVQGKWMSQNIKAFETRGKFKVDVARMKRVFANIEKGRPSGFSAETAELYINWLMTNIAKEDYQIDGSAEYLRQAAQKEGVVKTPSGLLFEVLKEGEGESPDANDMVYVRYEGRLIDGKVFNKSDEKNNAILNINETIPGWIEGLQMMKIGGKYRLYIPSELGYGEEGSKGIPGGAASIFDIELLDFRVVDEDGNFGDSVLQEKKKQQQKNNETK